LGTYRFEANNLASVTISTDDTDGVVVVDAVQFLLQDDENNSETKTEPKPVAQNQTQSVAAVESFESDELRAVKQKVNELNLQLKLLKQDAPRPIAKAMSVDEEPNPRDGHIHIRGSVRNLGDVVPRGFVSVISNEADNVEIPTDTSGRLELARWIANSEHPLTARVYVNRVWRHLFGKGLVATTDNFGKMGQRPSHPELLDYLASKFIEDGWSTKKLIREIILSRVFRMSTTAEATSAAVDPENRLLWRANRRRVDAEVLRDSMLAISGQLDLTTGGLTIRKIEQYDLGYKFDSVRRSVYVPAFRNTMLDLFEVFDIANPNLVVGNRNTSTLPTQALYLMNNPFVIEQSGLAAKRLLGETRQSVATERLRLAYLKTLGRNPTEEETRLALSYLAQFGDKTDEREQDAWTSLFHALFASLDFRYIN